VGPSVTRFELEMPPGISVKRIIAHKDDISLALASRAGIRIEAPIPGKSAVGIEVPNNHISTVGLREVVDSDDFLSSKSPVTFALGKDINGCIKTCNLAKMPHLLVAGATNSGKSIFLNALIISMIYKSSPDDLRLILIDPKRVEFSMYSNLPHLVIPNVITETEKASNALTWALNEMERRYEIFETERCRNIEEYNNSPNVISGEEKKLPYIVIVIDEFSDLMSIMKKEIEEKVKRLAQKARASGIHLVLTTQRPSVDVITGTIKTNFPSRISFALTSFADSKTILDQSGAENLLGKGDMLFLPSDANFPVRIQGCFVSNKEVKDVVQYIKENNQQEFDDEAGKEIESLVPNGEINDELSAQKLDPLSIKCLKFVIENGQASISSLQRNFALGFGKAGRIIDNLTKMGYISKQDGMKPRDVYLTMDGFKNLFGDE
ncbi:MAG: DNA translocase FtsK, partial [Clostridia bacterium]|nr:DNA translocase FtsK [Clostridia bacterium]